ncbi:MAG: hypothetical protein JO293_01330 [Candidatus Eremiobacteraeota bacterium]|nr:hypothetical protein [Candidatus Eremiobacteraeota bacterium]
MRTRLFAVIISLGSALLSLWACQTSARADSSCDAGYVQQVIRQGFAAIDARRWVQVHDIADQLGAYTGNCMHDFKVQNPTAVYSFYFYAVSLHHMNDDAHAEEAVAAGLRVLDQLKQQGGYDSLYDNVRPLFIDIQSTIAGHYD